MGFLAGEATQGELPGELPVCLPATIDKKFKLDVNVNSTRSIEGVTRLLSRYTCAIVTCCVIL